MPQKLSQIMQRFKALEVERSSKVDFRNQNGNKKIFSCSRTIPKALTRHSVGLCIECMKISRPFCLLRKSTVLGGIFVIGAIKLLLLLCTAE